MFTKKKMLNATCANRLFATDEKRAAHVRRYHITGTQQSQFQCADCGKTFDTPDQLGHHKTIHKLKSTGSYRHRKQQIEKQRGMSILHLNWMLRRQ